MYHVTRFRSLDESLIIPTQMAFLDFTVPDTNIVRQRTPLPSDFEHYFVQHETLLDLVGRVKDHRFTQCVEHHDLNLFYSPLAKVLFVEGKRKAITDLMKILPKHGYALDQYEVDFHQLEPYVKKVRGAWFTFASPDLQSSAFFGDGVDKTPEYRGAKSLGAISSLYLYHEHGLDVVPIMLTRSATVVLQRKIEDVALEIDILLSIYQSLMGRGLKMVLGKASLLPAPEHELTPGIALESLLPSTETP